MTKKIDSVNSQVGCDVNISNPDTVVSTLSLPAAILKRKGSNYGHLATKTALGKLYPMFQHDFWMKTPPNTAATAATDTAAAIKEELS